MLFSSSVTLITSKKLVENVKEKKLHQEKHYWDCRNSSWQHRIKRLRCFIFKKIPFRFYG